MPGGAHDPGESLTQTAIRETVEETGIAVRPTRCGRHLHGPRHAVHYTGNDEVRQEFTVVHRAEYLSGEPTTSSETTRVEWIPVDQLDQLTMDRSQRMRIEWALSQTGTWIDPTAD